MLIDLQKALSRIEYLERFISDGPSILEDIDKNIKEEKETFQNKIDTFETIQKDKRKQEGNLQLLQSKLEKYKEQSMAVKSNKEYQAILHEIELCEKEIEKAEEDVIVKMYEIDKLKSELKKDEGEHLKVNKALEEKRKNTEQELADAEKEIEELKAKREDLEKSLPEDILGEFNNILSIRDGVAIALAKDGICQACKIRIRPQVYLEVKTSEKLLSCDNCNRYLYREEG
jgi:predicted  nucleic acid-binding Zn-ribbon protein